MSETTENTLATVTFIEDGDQIRVVTDFGKGIPTGQMFGLVGKAIQGLMLTARKIGEAKGMTEEQVDDAIFEQAKS